MSDPSRHAEKRNALESFMRSIPGFKGYLEREYRRDSDRLVREWIADQLGKAKLAVDRWQRSMLDAGRIEAMPVAERLRSRLDRIQSRILGAVRGYSGFFDFVRVDETMLDDVYHLDMTLMGDASAILKTAEELSTSSTLQVQLESQLDAFDRSFDKRGELLKGLSP